MAIKQRGGGKAVMAWPLVEEFVFLRLPLSILFWIQIDSQNGFVYTRFENQFLWKENK